MRSSARRPCLQSPQYPGCTPIATRSQRLIGGISPGRIGLFTLMLASEAPVIAVRALLIEAAAAIVSILLGISLPLPAGWIALGSFAYAFAALILPAGDGWLFRQACHGHRPQQHDWETFYEAVMQLQVASGERPITLPADWFIVTNPTPAAALYEETLMVTSALMESDGIKRLAAFIVGWQGDTALCANQALMATPPVGVG